MISNDAQFILNIIRGHSYTTFGSRGGFIKSQFHLKGVWYIFDKENFFPQFGLESIISNTFSILSWFSGVLGAILIISSTFWQIFSKIGWFGQIKKVELFHIFGLKMAFLGSHGKISKLSRVFSPLARRFTLRLRLSLFSWGCL